MKKKLLLTLLAAVCAVCCALGLAACDNGNGDGGIKHKPSDILVPNVGGGNHYYQCTVEGCDEHHWNTSLCTYVNGVCTECGAQKPETLEEHNHVWSQTWEKNNYSHWHKCTFDGCQEQNGYGGHDFTSGDCVCGQEFLIFGLNGDKQSYTLTGVAGRQSDYTEMTVPTETIIIPETYDGKPVTAIGEGAFKYCNRFTGITIPCTVKSIGKNAFYKCGSLKSVTIPDGVTELASYAFGDCENLTDVTVPDSVTDVDGQAFQNCPIENATIPAPAARAISRSSSKAAEDLGFSINSKLKTVTVTSGDGIALWAFEGCAALTDITLPETIKAIEEYAFYNCSALEKITIPDGVTVIGDRAFQKCGSLTAISFPAGVTSISGSAFWECTQLADIEIHESTKIESGTFNDTAWYNSQPDGVVYLDKFVYGYKGNAYDVASVTVKDGTKAIANYALNYCRITNLTIPDGVTNIGEHSFGSVVNAVIPAHAAAYINNASLKTVTITSGNSIESYAFSGCEELSTIDIPDSVTSIGSNVFEDTAWYKSQPDNSVVYAGRVAYKYKGNKSDVTSVTLRNDTASIADSAFSYCTSLTGITVPGSVKKIGHYAFANCTSLTDVTIGGNVNEIKSSAFSGCTNLKTINFNGTKQQWDDIIKGNSWDGDTNIKINCTGANA